MNTKKKIVPKKLFLTPVETLDNVKTIQILWPYNKITYIVGPVSTYVQIGIQIRFHSLAHSKIYFII